MRLDTQGRGDGEFGGREGGRIIQYREQWKERREWGMEEGKGGDITMTLTWGLLVKLDGEGEGGGCLGHMWRVGLL